MAQTVWSVLFGRSQRRPSARRPAAASLAVEVLEDRLTPSGGPGPSGGGSGGGGPGPSGTTAIVSSTSDQVIATGSSGKTFQLGSMLTALSSGGLTLSQLFSGYPLAPSGGPSIQGDLLQTTNPSAIPAPMQNSTASVVPVLLTSSSSNGTTSYTMIVLDPSTGLTYSVPVTMSPPPSGTGG